MNEKFYVYGYLRERKTKHGDIGTYKYIGKGSGKRNITPHNNVKLPNDKVNNIKIIRYGLTENAALEMERTLILIYGRIRYNMNGKWVKGGGILENIMPGGTQPPNQTGYKRKTKRVWTQESKDKLSKSLTGLVKSQEHIDNIVAARIKNDSYGFSDESKEKMSITRQQMEIERREEMRKIHSKAGKANKGKPKSPEHIAAIKETWRLKNLEKQSPS